MYGRDTVRAFRPVQQTNPECSCTTRHSPKSSKFSSAIGKLPLVVPRVVVHHRSNAVLRGSSPYRCRQHVQQGPQHKINRRVRRHTQGPPNRGRCAIESVRTAAPSSRNKKQPKHKKQKQKSRQYVMNKDLALPVQIALASALCGPALRGLVAPLRPPVLQQGASHLESIPQTRVARVGQFVHLLGVQDGEHARGRWGEREVGGGTQWGLHPHITPWL